jgi:enterochelin esterase-like enzyme
MKILFVLLLSIALAMDPSAYMEKFRNDIVTPEPQYILTKQYGKDYGRVERINYYSSFCGRQKEAIVILPPGYNEGEKYPVLYVNHGVFGSANDMLSEEFGIQTMAVNLWNSGKAEKMIIVLTNTWSSKTNPFPINQFTDEMERSYDNFLYDIAQDLIPHIDSHYSVKPGRENRAISGFSLGGREALYIGISRPDLFGYIGGACPAPGIVPAVDMYMYHRGSMTENEFKIKDGAPKPYLLFITGGDADGVVGTFPNQYHTLFSLNGCDHAWQLVPGGQHNGSSVRAHFFNFLRYVFRADKN